MARSFYKSFLLWTRTLHIYATMLALVLLIFFSFTGFVMNHTEFFSLDKNVKERNVVLDITMPEELLKHAATVPAESMATKPEAPATQSAMQDDEPNMWAPRPSTHPTTSTKPAEPMPDMLATDNPARRMKPSNDLKFDMQVEVFLRLNGARGECEPIDEQEDSIHVNFTGAGRKMEYTISKADGRINLHEEVRSALALMADMHKGTGTGGKWRLLIDGTAIFLLFASLSGLVLWIALPKRRTLGIIALALSIVLCGGCFLWLMP
jgi:hypothetical protein